jgi:NADPH-dependent 2,4-dienoyl-CoA reductase/sulfur reductase-like enzyme
MFRPRDLTRRAFVRSACASVPASLTAGAWMRAAAAGQSPTRRVMPAARPRELDADVVVIGAGFGGCAAALAAARHGLRVVMTEETDWIGGQLTAQAVPLDENAWIESTGGTRS